MINNYECTPDDGKTCNAVPSPGPEPIASMLSMANDLTPKALDMTLHISSQVLGSPMPEMETNEPSVCGMRWTSTLGTCEPSARS